MSPEPAEPVQLVLAHTAEALEDLEQFRKDYLKGRVAGHLYQAIAESAKYLYSRPAIEHLERQLGVSQLQFWHQKSIEDAVAVLRAAAQATLPPDLEVLALRSQIRILHDRLREALDDHTVQDGAVLNEAIHAIERFKKSETV